MNKVFIGKEIRGPTDTESLLCFIQAYQQAAPSLVRWLDSNGNYYTWGIQETEKEEVTSDES